VSGGTASLEMQNHAQKEGDEGAQRGGVQGRAGTMTFPAQEL